MRPMPSTVRKLGMPLLVVGAVVVGIAAFPLAVVASFFLFKGNERWSAGTIAGGLALCAAFWIVIIHAVGPALPTVASAPSAPNYGYSVEEQKFLQSQGVSPAEARAVETAICRDTPC